MKKSLHLLPFKLAAASLLCVAALCVTASAASASLKGDTLTVCDLSPAADQVIAAGYDSQGKMLFARTAKVERNSSGALEGTVTLPDQNAASVKAFFLTASQAPAEAPLDVTPGAVQGMADRLWVCQQICDFWNVDLSLYDESNLIFDDCKSLSIREKQAVLAAMDLGGLNGYDSKTFAPGELITRAQAARILCRTVGNPSFPDNMTPGYSDVSNNTWYYDDVCALRYQKVLPDTEQFLPDQKASREDFSQWLEGLKPLRDQIRSGASVSDVRFEMSGGTGHLAWDYTPPSSGAYPEFDIYAKDASGKWQYAFSTDWNFPVLTLPAGTCTAFKVNMVSDGLTLAAAEASLTLNVTDGGTNAASGAFLRFTRLDAGRYSLLCGGMADYSAAELIFERGDSSWWNFAEVNPDGTAFSFQSDDRDGTLSDSTFSLFGFDRYTINGNTMTCRATRLLENRKPELLPFSLSGVRFGTEKGFPVIAWDSNTQHGVNYTVFVRPVDGGSWQEIGGTDNACLPVMALPGSWQGVRVEARDARTGSLLGAAENDALTIRVNDGGTDSARVLLTYMAQSDDRFDVTLTGMSGYQTFSVKFSPDSDGRRDYGCFDTLPDSGSAYFSIHADPNAFMPPNGYCRITGGKNYVLSGNSLSYDYYILKDWTRTP